MERSSAESDNIEPPEHCGIRENYRDKVLRF